jgi:hypothetical protein
MNTYIKPNYVTPNTTKFNVNGETCVLNVSYDYEDDNTKAFHDLISIETDKIITTLHWSPYSDPSDEEVQQMIDMGLPEGFHYKGEQSVFGRNFCSEILEDYRNGNTKGIVLNKNRNL